MSHSLANEHISELYEVKYAHLLEYGTFQSSIVRISHLYFLTLSLGHDSCTYVRHQLKLPKIGAII